MLENSPNRTKVMQEIVAYRYSDEESIMLVGEAEVALEVLNGCEEGEPLANLCSVRVDILTAFDPQGFDVYKHVMCSDALRSRLEAAALDHYFHPPKVPISLPKRVREW
jgi:hypothetical protein